MSRLYDRLLVSKRTPKHLKESFNKNPPVVVDATSVAEYVYRNRDIAIAWDKQPFYKSPFDYVFIECQRPLDRIDLPFAWGVGMRWAHYHYPPRTPEEEAGMTKHEWTKRELVRCKSISDEVGLSLSAEESFAYQYGLNPEYGVNFEVVFDGVFEQHEYRYHHCHIFIEPQIGDEIMEAWSLSWIFDNYEDLVPKEMWAVPSPKYDPYERLHWSKRGETYNDYESGLTDQGHRVLFDLATPLFMALTLMSCKNVELEDNYPLTALSEKHKHKHKRSLTTFKTIKVNPMRTVKHYTDLDTQQPSNSQPSNTPLHIVRGHFKDFRDGKGLFGKYKDVFWWDQAVRGSIDNGAVIKDYDVQAPKD